MVFPNVFTAVRAFYRWVRAFIRREPTLVSEEVLQHRLGRCRSCTRYDLDSGQCLECTCFVDLKAQLSTEKCPLDKWKE